MKCPQYHVAYWWGASMACCSLKWQLSGVAPDLLLTLLIFRDASQNSFEFMYHCCHVPLSAFPVQFARICQYSYSSSITVLAVSSPHNLRRSKTWFLHQIEVRLVALSVCMEQAWSRIHNWGLVVVLIKVGNWQRRKHLKTCLGF